MFQKYCVVFQELFVVFADMGHRKGAKGRHSDFDKHCIEQVPDQTLPCWASCGVGEGLDLAPKCFFLEAIQMPTNGRVDK